MSTYALSLNRVWYWGVNRGVFLACSKLNFDEVKRLDFLINSENFGWVLDWSESRGS